MLRRSWMFVLFGVLAGTAAALSSMIFSHPAAQAEAPGFKVGKVRYEYLLANHPEMSKATNAIEIFHKQKQLSLDARLNELTGGKDGLSSDMEGKAREIYEKENEQYLKERRDKERQMYKPIIDSVLKIIEDTAKAKKMDLVLDDPGVIYGGDDITDEVIRKIAASK